MESEGVLSIALLIHEHPMMPWNDLRKGDCCDRFESQSDGYYCKSCDLFVHKKCGDGELSEFIDHPYHPDHTLRLRSRFTCFNPTCDLCDRRILFLSYRCDICNFDLDLRCFKYTPPEVIDNFKMHNHKLTLLKERNWMTIGCSAKCGKYSRGFTYKCEECEVAFHVDCVWHPPEELNYSTEVNHSYHTLHPLKLLTGQPPDYSDGKCRLCGRNVDIELFYHCSSCNFTLDMPCVLHPPPQSVMDLKAHDHQLTLLPRLDSFTCNACGLKGDQSPYICVPCGFMIHQECLRLPRVININRHDHRVSRTTVLGVVNSVCGVCRKKVDWTCGGFSCLRCPGYVVHSKCATRKDVWNGKELEGVPEEDEDIEPYVVIDDNTIHHFSHKDHHLRLHGNCILYEENKRCSACTHPIALQSFYGCMDCDFSLHQKCAKCPKRKRHVLHNERLTLSTNKDLEVFRCHACSRWCNGFMYKHGHKKLDVLCGSVSEPFVHPSHLHHPLYYMPTEKGKICNGCNTWEPFVLICIEGDCGFVLCFRCATLPQVVKHRVDDYPLSLCYGEEASGKYWCDICEKETSPKNWFYTCKDQQASLHIECVLGSYIRLMPRSIAKFWGKSYEVVPNNSVTRPFCNRCKSRCMYPINLKLLGTSETYLCSLYC
ncbi:DC1 domain-containing protein [Hirschfeldia incana]|nr:DC1 domain-containing protein [Hirschfeldia incana]